MKKLILSIALLMLIVSGAFAQFGNGYSKSQSDGRYFKINDGVEGYTATQIDSANAIDRQNKHQNDFKDLSGYDYEFPVGGYTFGASTVTLTDGQPIYVSYNIKKARTITSVTYSFATAQAAYTADNYNGFVLFSVNKTTGACTEIARTTNDGNIWKGAINTAITTNFTTPVVIQPGFYAVGALLNSTATPSPVVTLCANGTINVYTHTFLNSVRVAWIRGAPNSDMFTPAQWSDYVLSGTICNFLLK